MKIHPGLEPNASIAVQIALCPYPSMAHNSRGSRSEDAGVQQRGYDNLSQSPGSLGPRRQMNEEKGCIPDPAILLELARMRMPFANTRSGC